jgi:hypothetical protein
MPHKMSDFNLDILGHTESGNSDLYREVLLDMAKFLRDNKKLQESLLTYLQVSYLDTIQPEGSNNTSDQKVIELFPDQTQSSTSHGSVIINEIYHLSQELEIKYSDLKTHYLDVASRLHKNMKLPLNPEVGWKELEQKLNNCKVKP